MRRVNNLKQSLAKRRLRLTRLRAEVWKVFRDQEHMTARELHRLLSTQNVQIGLTAIYRTLNCFRRAGLAEVCHFGERAVYAKVSQKGHHAYLICTSCARIV
jgi:Fe2+ or Zn2+ uptake regulation protein